MTNGGWWMVDGGWWMVDGGWWMPSDGGPERIRRGGMEFDFGFGSLDLLGIWDFRRLPLAEAFAVHSVLANTRQIIVDHFLRILKPYHEAGLINALGVVALFAVVLVALLPHFLQWLRRPRLQVAIPGNYFAPRQDFSNEQIGVYTMAALFVLRNAGRSDASRIRAVATDFYKFMPGPEGSCDHVRSSQHALEGSEIDLPAGFSAPILLCSFSGAGRFKSGFVIGRSIKCSFTFASPTIPSGVKFSPPQDLDAGAYVARVIISGSNVLPTEHLMMMVLGEEASPELGEEIRLGVAGPRERRAVRQADRRRQKFQMG